MTAAAGARDEVANALTPSPGARCGHCVVLAERLRVVEARLKSARSFEVRYHQLVYSLARWAPHNAAIAPAGISRKEKG